MGFRTGAYAKVWESSPAGATTKLKISISRKRKDTGEYEQEFSGFAYVIGTAVADKATKLKSGDSIKLGDVDVTNKYDKDKKVTYTNYKIFSFEKADSGNAAGKSPEADIEDSVSDLPF